MLNENIKNLRKQKGLTQQELAIRLNVVRQTVSKWEKGLSVPDAEMLQKTADVLETEVSVLLGKTIEPASDTDQVAEQLAKISEQLCIRNRRWRIVWKVIGITAAVVLALNLLLAAAGVIAFQTVKTEQTVVSTSSETVEVMN